MRPVTFTMGPYAAASQTAICLAQTPAAAGPLILNGPTVAGGVATLDIARNVVINTTADERPRTLTIEGTDWRGDPIGEVLQGVNVGTVVSVNNYLTITAVRISGPAAGAITVGTALPVYSPWVRLDDYGGAFLNYSLAVSGAATYTVQQSFDDPNSPTNPVAPAAVNWQPSSIAALVGASTTQQGAYGSVPPWLRVMFSAGTGSLTATFLQPG
jgi:hypothetical protein